MIHESFRKKFDLVQSTADALPGQRGSISMHSPFNQAIRMQEGRQTLAIGVRYIEIVMLAKMRQEPAMVVALLGSVLALLAAFGLSLTAEQTGALMAVVSAVLGLLTRSLVSPVVSEPAQHREV